MPTSYCYPWWHAAYAQLAAQAWTKTIIPSGCSTNISTGNVSCSPSTMRASAEAWLANNAPQALVMMGGRLSQDVYTFARYMHSEVGSGTVEERVAVGEAGMRRAQRTGVPISRLLMPNGYYGPIHAASENVCLAMGYERGVKYGSSVPNRCSNTTKPNTCCSPFKRWASTSRDPSIMSLLLAHLVVSGQSNNFARDADDQDGPENWISYGQTSLDNYVKRLANDGKFWVGPLPGVDHWHTFLQFTPGPIIKVAQGSALMQRGLEALRLPAQRPMWPANLPVCGKPASKLGLVVTTALGIGVGALAFRRFTEPR